MNDKFYSGKSLNDLVKEVEIDVIWCHRSGGLVVFLYPFRRRFILSEVRIRPEWIEISGHAGYAESGKDIVCASITAFTQTLNKSVEGLTMRCARVGIQIKPIKSASFQKSLRIFFSIFKTYLIQYRLSDNEVLAQIKPVKSRVCGSESLFWHQFDINYIYFGGLIWTKMVDFRKLD